MDDPASKDTEMSLNQKRSASATDAMALPLWKNISWTFAGNMVYVLCQWGMLMVLAKLGSPEMVGRFALGLAVTAPIMLFANLALRQVQATDARSQYVFGDYLGLRLITTLLALSIIICVAFAGYRMETALVVLAVGLAKSFEAVSDVFYGLLQQRERMDRVARSMMIKGPLSLVVLGLMVYVTGSVFWGAVGLAAAWAAVLLGYDLRSGALILASRTQPRWGTKNLVRLASFALPLGFVAALISLNANIPRYFLEHYFSEREVGIFSAMAYIMVAGGFVINAVAHSVSPRLAGYYAEGDRSAFVDLLIKLCTVGVLTGAGGVLVAVVAGGSLLSLLYTPEYARYDDAFAWLMVAAGISYVAIFLNVGIMASRHFRAQVPVVVCVVTTTIVAGVVLIPPLGITGAAISVVVGIMVQMIGGLGILVYAVRLAGRGY